MSDIIQPLRTQGLRLSTFVSTFYSENVKYFCITENISTSTLYHQILAENMLVQVAFVGPHLSTLVDILDKVNDRSFLVLHYNPSILTIKHSLVPIIFPDCKDPLLQRDPSDANCLYTPNRLAKVVWDPVQNEAPELFKFIQHFGFTVSEYKELLNAFIEQDGNEETANYEEIACTWLHKIKSMKLNNGTLITKTVYEERMETLPQQGKPELYIGGIFPITGNKYRAPELATGNSKLRRLKFSQNYSYIQLLKWRLKMLT